MVNESMSEHVLEIAIAYAMKTLAKEGLINFKEKTEPSLCGWCHGDAIMKQVYFVRSTCTCAYNCGVPKCNGKGEKVRKK